MARATFRSNVTPPRVAERFAVSHFGRASRQSENAAIAASTAVRKATTVAARGSTVVPVVDAVVGSNAASVVDDAGAAAKVVGLAVAGTVELAAAATGAVETTESATFARAHAGVTVPKKEAETSAHNGRTNERTRSAIHSTSSAFRLHPILPLNRTVVPKIHADNGSNKGRRNPHIVFPMQVAMPPNGATQPKFGRISCNATSSAPGPATVKKSSRISAVALRWLHKRVGDQAAPTQTGRRTLQCWTSNDQDSQWRT